MSAPGKWSGPTTCWVRIKGLSIIRKDTCEPLWLHQLRLHFLRLMRPLRILSWLRPWLLIASSPKTITQARSEGVVQTFAVLAVAARGGARSHQSRTRPAYSSVAQCEQQATQWTDTIRILSSSGVRCQVSCQVSGVMSGVRRQVSGVRCHVRCQPSRRRDRQGPSATDAGFHVTIQLSCDPTVQCPHICSCCVTTSTYPP